MPATFKPYSIAASNSPCVYSAVEKETRMKLMSKSNPDLKTFTFYKLHGDDTLTARKDQRAETLQL